jgi:hypothetical protein
MTPPTAEGRRVPTLDATEWRIKYEQAMTYEHLPWCGCDKWTPHDHRCHCITPRVSP